jgi:hypothetical protein
MNNAERQIEELKAKIQEIADDLRIAAATGKLVDVKNLADKLALPIFKIGDFIIARNSTEVLQICSLEEFVAFHGSQPSYKYCAKGQDGSVYHTSGDNYRLWVPPTPGALPPNWKPSFDETGVLYMSKDNTCPRYKDKSGKWQWLGYEYQGPSQYDCSLNVRVATDEDIKKHMNRGGVNPISIIREYVKSH